MEKRRKGASHYKKIIFEDYIKKYQTEPIDKFYDSKFPINGTKKTRLLNVVSSISDDKERNAEDYMAELILNNGIITKLNELESKKDNPYESTHCPQDINFNESSNRRENNIVRLLYKNKDNINKSDIFSLNGEIGEIIDYEIPLQSGTKHNIDMLTLTDGNINIVEWKTDANFCADSLLRTALEIKTYECELNKEQHLGSYERLKGHLYKPIKKIIAIFENTKPAKSFYLMHENKNLYANLHKLLNELDIKIVILSKDSFPNPIDKNTKLNPNNIKVITCSDFPQ